MSVRVTWIWMLVALAGCNGSSAIPAGRKDAGSNPEVRIADAATDDARRFDDAAAADAPLADLRATDLRGADSVVADVPVADVPVADVPIADVPVADVPVADVPVADAAVADRPALRDATPDRFEARPDGVCAYAGLTLLPGQAYPDPLTQCQMCRCGSDGKVTCSPSDRACCRLSSTDILAVDEIRYVNGCKARSCRFEEDEGVNIDVEPGCHLGCFYAGQWRAMGSEFPGDSGCQSCRCDSGTVTCTEVACSRCDYYGHSYPDGADFVAADGLSTCHCGGGKAECTAQAHPDGTCAYFGTAYAAGAEFLGRDGCSRCRCSDGRVLCYPGECSPLDQCEYAGKVVFATSAPFLGEDGCSRCFCDQGTVNCVADGCQKVCVDRGRTFVDGASFDLPDADYNSCECQAGTLVCADLPLTCAHQKDYWHKYVASTAAECAAIRPACPEHTTYFANACGCGCEQNLACPRYLICRGAATSPDQAICPPAEQIAACPYSQVVYQ